MNDSQVIQEMALLYELSLAIGISPNSHETCRLFLHPLVARKNLDFAAVWIYTKDNERPQLLYGLPAFQLPDQQVLENTQLFTQNESREYLIFPADDNRYQHTLKDVSSHGSFLQFRLSGLGVLEMYSSKSAALTPQFANQLNVLVKKFTIALQGCFAIERNQQEILERQLAEENLLAYTRKLEQSNRDLKEFAYLVTHDLQEPLRKIRVFCSRLLKAYDLEKDSNKVDMAQRIFRSAERMQAFLDQLVVYTHITANKPVLLPINLHHLVAEVVSQIQAGVNVRQSAQFQISSLPQIYGESSQIRQLFTQLLDNTIKFAHPERSLVVTISSQKIFPRSHTGRASYLIGICDNGIGFDNKYHQRIFGMFERLHGSSSKYPGTGIGLALCRKIVERHHGQIWAEGTMAEGATIYVQLPAEKI